MGGMNATEKRRAEQAADRQRQNDADVDKLIWDPTSGLLPAKEYARQAAQAKVRGYGIGVDLAVAAALEAYDRRVSSAVYRLTNIDTRDAVMRLLSDG